MGCHAVMLLSVVVGYTGDGLSCSDVDECVVGYTGNGLSCSNVVECCCRVYCRRVVMQ